MAGKTRNWMFTLNNPDTEKELEWPLNVKGAWWQLEKGEQGTLHYQGYLELRNPCKLAGVKEIQCLQGAHFEPRRGSKRQAIKYCSKEETRVAGPYVYGETETEQGQRSDIDEFCKAVQDGLKESDAIFSFPGMVAKYPRFVKSFFEACRVRRLPAIGLVPREGWQTELFEYLKTEPHPRQILWFSDHTGATGKSTFANSTPDAYVVTPGKHADIVYAYNFERIVFFDWPRDAEDRFPYSVAESFKNGYFLSTKYEVRRVRFSVPHVVVFSNNDPDLLKLSFDRFVIKRI